MALATEERSAVAYRRAAQASIQELAAYLQELFGQKLTALIAGVRDPKAVGKWARGEREPQPGAVARLRATFQIAELLLQAESPQTVRAWFMGMNPGLDDRTPALILAEEGDRPERVRDVLQAARACLVEG